MPVGQYHDSECYIVSEITTIISTEMDVYIRLLHCSKLFRNYNIAEIQVNFCD